MPHCQRAPQKLSTPEDLTRKLVVGWTNDDREARGASVTGRVPISLELLRQEARDELAAVIEYRCRLGDDPWEFIPELPSVDEHVVRTLRADTIAELDLTEAQSRAHHPSSGASSRGAFEYQVLRRIALEHPDLSPAVWQLLDHFEAG
jgi:hypothetical protein